MGQIAEDTINGFYCEQCGVVIDGEEPGYSRKCEDCEEDDKRTTKVCKDCNKPFSISQKELNWLKEKGLKQFKRCSDCREKRRNK